MAKKSASPYTFSLAIWIMMLLFTGFGINYWLDEIVNIWIQVFLTANSASFLLFGFDKLQAITKRERIPEIILYASAFLGGPIGAILAMHVFRHKTRKPSFQLVLAFLILIQIYIAVVLIG